RVGEYVDGDPTAKVGAVGEESREQSARAEDLHFRLYTRAGPSNDVQGTVSPRRRVIGSDVNAPAVSHDPAQSMGVVRPREKLALHLPGTVEKADVRAAPRSGA